VKAFSQRKNEEKTQRFTEKQLHFVKSNIVIYHDQLSKSVTIFRSPHLLVVQHAETINLIATHITNHKLIKLKKWKQHQHQKA